MSNENTLHANHRLVLCESIYSKLMLQNAFRVAYESVINSHKVISVWSDCLSCIDRPEKSILEYPVLSELDSFEGEAEKEEKKSKYCCYDEANDQNFPPILHISNIY